MLAGERSVRDTKMIRNHFLDDSRKIQEGVENISVAEDEKGNCGQQLIRNDSLSTWLSFIETFMKSRKVREVSGYSAFTFEPLDNLHLVISKLVKNRTVSYLSS